MNIVECKEMRRIKEHDLVPTIIDHVFTICKEDKNFNISSDIKHIDKKVNLIDSKIFKQKALQEKSNTIKKELLKKIKRIEDESFKIKYKVLEFLGSEL